MQKCGAIVKDYGDIDKKLYSHMEKIDGESGRVYTYDFLSQDETCKALNVYFDKNFYLDDSCLELYDTKNHLVETVNYNNKDTEYFTIPDNGFKIKFYPSRYYGGSFAVKKIVNASIAAPALGHNYVEKSSVAPTCTTGGSRTYECSRCKDIKQEAVVKEIAVNADEYKDFATTFSSCSTNSTKEYVYEAKNEHCQKIKFTLNNTGMGSNNYFEVYDSNDNVVKTYTGTINDTIEVSGNKVRFVLSTSNDSSLYNNIRISDLTEYVMPDAPLGHNYKKTIVDATCTEPGYEIYTCERCGDTYEKHSNSVVIDKSKYAKLESSHPVYDNTRTYSYTSENKNCTEITLFFDVRTLANNIKVYDTKGNLVESFTSGNGSAKVVKVKDNGFKISVDYNWGKFGFKINKMIETISPIIKPLGHEYELVKHDQPTCTEYGTKHYKCTRCDSTKQIGRKNLEDKEIDKTEYKNLSNCFNKNIDAYSSIEYIYTAKNKNCTKISLSFRDRYCYSEKVFVSFYDKNGNLIKNVTGILDSQNVEIPGNSFKIVVKNVDRFSYSGGINFEKITETFSAEDGIVPLGHDYQKSGHVAPACTEAGYDKYKCTRCDSSYTEYVGLDVQEVNKNEYSDIFSTFYPHYDGIKTYTFTSKHRNCKELKVYLNKDRFTVLSNVKFFDLYDNLIYEYKQSDTISITELTIPGNGFKIVAEGNSQGGNGVSINKVEEILINENDAPLGHDYHRSAIGPTCTKGGGYLYKCSRCEHSYTEEVFSDGYEKIDKSEYAHIESPHYTELNGRKYYNFKSKNPNCNEIKIYFNKNTGPVLYSLTSLVTSPYNQGTNATLSQDETGRIVATVPGNGFTLICQFEGNESEYGFSIDKIEQKITKLVEPATGHQYVKTGHVDATCAKEGYDIYTCSKCNAVLNKATKEIIEDVDKSKYENIILTKEQNYTQLSLNDTDCQELILHLSKDSYMSNEDTLVIYDVKQTKMLGVIQGNLYEDTITLSGDGFLMTLQSNNPDSQIKFEKIEKKTTRTLYPKVPHNYQLTNTVPATCTEDGYDVMTCDMCGAEKQLYSNQETIDVPQERYKEIASTTSLKKYKFVSDNPNCTSLIVHFNKDVITSDYTYLKIKGVNDEEYSRVSGSDIITIQGNQFELSWSPYYDNSTCTYSVDKIEQVITTKFHPALGHDYQVSKIVEPTCTENGYDVMTCSRCGDSYERRSTKRDVEVNRSAYANIFSPHYTDDDFSKSFEFVAPDENCEEITLHFSDKTDFGSNGYLTVYDAHYNKIAELENKCSDKVIKVPGNSCKISVSLASGSKVYGFSLDKVTQKVPVPLYPAAHKYHKIKTVEPTCTQDGYDVMTCDVCGDTYNDKHLIDGINVINKEKYQQIETSHPYNRDDKTYVYKSDDKNCKKIVLYFNEQTKFNKTNSYYETAELSIYDGDDNLIQTLKGECPNAVVEVPGNVAKLDFSPNQYGDLQYGFSIDKIEEYTLVPTNKALGHDFDIRHVGHTCTSNGYDVYNCKRCGLSEEKESTQRGWKSLDKQEFIHMQTSHPFKTDDPKEYVFQSNDANCVELKVTFNPNTKCNVYSYGHDREKGFVIYDLDGNEVGNSEDCESTSTEGVTFNITGNGFKVVLNKYLTNEHPDPDYGFAIDEIQAKTLIPTDPAAHVPDGDIKYVAPTCEENARNEYTCKYCGKKIVEDLYEKDKKNKKIIEKNISYKDIPNIVPKLDYTTTTTLKIYDDLDASEYLKTMYQPFILKNMANAEMISMEFDLYVDKIHSDQYSFYDGAVSYQYLISDHDYHDTIEHIVLNGNNINISTVSTITSEDWKQGVKNFKIKYYDNRYKAIGHKYFDEKYEVERIKNENLEHDREIYNAFSSFHDLRGSYITQLDKSCFSNVSGSETQLPKTSVEDYDKYWKNLSFSNFEFNFGDVDKFEIADVIIGLKISTLPDSFCLSDNGRGNTTEDLTTPIWMIKMNEPERWEKIKDKVCYVAVENNLKLYTEEPITSANVSEMFATTYDDMTNSMPLFKSYNDKNKKFKFYVVTLDMEEISNEAGVVSVWTKDKDNAKVLNLATRSQIVVPYEEFFVDAHRDYYGPSYSMPIKNIDIVYDSTGAIESQDSTCINDGQVILKCQICNKLHTNSISSKGHVLMDNKVDSLVGDLTYNKFELYPIAVCYNDVKNDENRFNLPYAVTIPATCTEPAYKALICCDCGEILEKRAIEDSAPLGHAYTNQGVLNPTCCTEGKKGTICRRCGKFKDGEYEVIPKIEHTYRTKIVDATCNQDGYECQYCSVCGLEKNKKNIPASHNYKTKEQVLPTTTTPGYIIYECSECGHINKVDQPVIENVAPSTPSTPSTPPPPVTEYVEPTTPSISIDSLSLVFKTINSLKLKWNGNADGYYVYLKKEGSNAYKKIATVTDTSYTCTKLNSCTKYDYYVVGYKRVSGKLFYTNKLYGSVITNIKKPSIKSLKTKKRKLRIKYSKVHNATDYQIQISTNSSFKKAKIYSVKGKLPRLKRNKKYYVRIRVYRKIDQKAVYSSWSKIKTIKT